jgi:hypothetical protein
MKKEPAITVGSITALVVAVLALAASFGLHLSDEQRNAIVGVLAVVGPIVAGYVTRSKVTPA